MVEIILVDNINASNAAILPISNGIVLSIPARLVNNQHLDMHHEHAMDASMMTESTDIMILKENTRKTSPESVEVHVLFTNVLPFNYLNGSPTTLLCHHFFFSLFIIRTNYYGHNVSSPYFHP
jgi:hypothetical protein